MNKGCCNKCGYKANYIIDNNNSDIDRIILKMLMIFIKIYLYL